MSNGPIEPSADLRAFATTMRQMHLALVQEGFNKDEAMQIIGVTLASNLGGGS